MNIVGATLAFREGNYLFNLGEDVQLLSPSQIEKLLSKPMCTIKEYEEKKFSTKS